MLDADAVSWWQDLRKQGKLTALSRDYAYVSFFDAAGRPLDIRPEDTQVNGKIAPLALQIRQDLEIPQVREGAGPSPQKPSSAAAAEGIYVVVLGHPTVALPPEMGEPIRKLCEGLKGRGVRMQAWRDGWRRKADARGQIGSAANAIFVQPVAEGEAADLAANPGVIAQYLEAAGCPNAKVALWLPSGFNDHDFKGGPKRRAARARFPRFAQTPPRLLRIGFMASRRRTPRAKKLEFRSRLSAF